MAGFLQKDSGLIIFLVFVLKLDSSKKDAFRVGIGKEGVPQNGTGANYIFLSATRIKTKKKAKRQRELLHSTWLLREGAITPPPAGST
jgi:hypothetical protein